ncbi:MAG: transglutaminase [Bdellovibrio sp.]|nr:MAG: transglutaminase [Bdellovibrio sp.]
MTLFSFMDVANRTSCLDFYMDFRVLLTFILLGKKIYKEGLFMKISKILFVIFFLVSIALIFYKAKILGYSPQLLLPEKNYLVTTTLTGSLDEGMVHLKTFLPVMDFRQSVSDESFQANGFDYEIQNDGENRVVSFSNQAPQGPFKVEIEYSVSLKGVSWDIDKNIQISENNDHLAGEDSLYLKETPMIPYNHPKIAKLFEKLVGRERSVYQVIKKSYNYVKGFKNLAFKGSTSALTALLLKKASCNGKSRLMVALLRKAGIPSRLVGGLILKNGNKKITHQWVEAKIKEHWVSFDPTNDHFAQIPSNYLKLYVGDRVLFSHTPNISFNWNFHISSYLSPSSQLYKLRRSKLNVLNLFRKFQETGVSINILKILLMIPVGALIATFFRNVIGLQTFGTFLPALIAASSIETGIVWGLLGFVIVILIIAFLRIFFEALDLMHTPKLSAMLTLVVALLIGLSILSVHSPLNLTHVSLFPIAILTLTSERFSITIEEKGYLKAFSIMLQTLFVTAVCYAFMSSLFLQTLFLAFPEIGVLIVGANIILGRWVGLRLVEFWRFRSLIFKENI